MLLRETDRFLVDETLVRRARRRFSRHQFSSTEGVATSVPLRMETLGSPRDGHGVGRSGRGESALSPVLDNGVAAACDADLHDRERKQTKKNGDASAPPPFGIDPPVTAGRQPSLTS